MSTPATLAVLSLSMTQVGSAWAVETVRIKMAEVSKELSLNAKALWFGPDSEEASFPPHPQATGTVRQVGSRMEVNGVPW
ncbi:MAG TPA: hypothetical protein VF947_05440, partial [Myxococcales bacterium]